MVQPRECRHVSTLHAGRGLEMGGWNQAESTKEEFLDFSFALC